jgi:hypothetical protein
VKKSPCIPQYSGAWIVPPPPPLMHAQSQAIADAVVRERSRLHGFIRRRVPSTADAEDIFQDNWYEFARACSLPDPIEQVGAWLFRVARNRIIDRRSVKRAGLFEATLQKLFTRSAHVVDIVDIGSAFRIITLGGDGLRTWPGRRATNSRCSWAARSSGPAPRSTGTLWPAAREFPSACTPAGRAPDGRAWCARETIASCSARASRSSRRHHRSSCSAMKRRWDWLPP